MAKRMVRVSDLSRGEITDGKGATVRIVFADARKGVIELDVTERRRRTSWAVRAGECLVGGGSLRRRPDPEAGFTPALVHTDLATSLRKTV
jgi:hypothetical protein